MKEERTGKHDVAKECISILCLQKTKWKRSKPRNIEGGCKVLYNEADGRKNEIRIVVREELVESVLEVKRVSDRLMAMKLEKNNFWEDLNGLIESVSKQERIVLDADLNGHVGEGNIGDEEIMGVRCWNKK